MRSASIARFVTDARGCRHWGPHGAAGLLIRCTTRQGARFLLQRRALWTQHGGTWSIPGGALNRGESARRAAFREAAEEMGPLPLLRDVLHLTDDHGGWVYRTFLVEALTEFTPRRGDGEGSSYRWCAARDVTSLRLHPGFARAWPQILQALKDHP